mmetsp:Transcript_25228/g.24996  ORF Transcript_25228/g.24996 Transcript_25228/m.24996 type:complete len:180 (-) Transcript_25228:134-673(-)
MSLTNKIPAKVFKEIVPRKYSRALDDCEICDYVLSESAHKAPQPRETVVRKPRTKKLTIKSTKKNDILEVKGVQNFKDMNTIRKSPQPQLKQLDKDSSFFRVCEKSPDKLSTSLKSDISNLLQQLIHKKKQKKESKAQIFSKKKCSSMVVKKTSEPQDFNNYILTMRDVHQPDLEDADM